MRKTKVPRYKRPEPTDVKGDDGEYSAVPRIARVIPYGYKQSEEDPDILEPVVLKLAALEIAKDYNKQYSYRQVADWLYSKTGRYISHTGLRKRLLNDRSRKSQAATLRKWAEYAEKAIAKAETLEKGRIGSKEKSTA